MSYMATGATEPTLSSAQEKMLLDRVNEIILRQKQEESRRRWTLLIAGIGAVFAAVRLGVIVVPKVRARRRTAAEL
jgi:hypothetical protein